MNTSTQMRYVPTSVLLRWCGRAAGVVLFVSWLILFAVERARLGAPSPEAYPQAAALALVFTGYLAGWRNELVGGVLAILGTAVFFVACMKLMGILPPAEALMFALPGVFYLLASHFDHLEIRHGESDET